MSTPATIPLRFGSAGGSPATASLRGLDGVNFFLAAALAGFGPYVAVYLADQKWTQDKIGFVLSASALAGLLSQVPGGELLDSTRSKRAIVALSVLPLALSAMIIEFQPTFPLVLIGLTLQGITGAVLGPAVTAISLGVVGHTALPERLGRNQRFAATGSLAAAALMGLIGYAFSYRAIFLLVAALTLPLFVALAHIHATDIHFGRSCGAPPLPHTRYACASPPREPVEEPGLACPRRQPFLVSARQRVHTAACRRGTYISGGAPFLVDSLGIDRVAADRCCSDGSMVGRQAKHWGRRPLLLIGFGALPLRAVLFAFITDPTLFLVFQLLDGISGAVVGVSTALVVADLTNGSGRFNLAQALVGTASGIGASLSTALFGFIAAVLGRTVVFLSIASVAVVAVLILWLLMPETKPSTELVGSSGARPV